MVRYANAAIIGCITSFGRYMTSHSDALSTAYTAIKALWPKDSSTEKNPRSNSVEDSPAENSLAEDTHNSSSEQEMLEAAERDYWALVRYEKSGRFSESASTSKSRGMLDGMAEPVVEEKSTMEQESIGEPQHRTNSSWSTADI
ncbi:hypothetical protein BU23DRAFT_186006 [Bimuria novae-zelandiae CBS 107.79]|uniref:Uncharacterized protein n=1 Tax=Bimuria novae-zelandiae CBS 107.79 TaxID=1447943 RepID=A0A6A5V5K3_9PLEO|nr:hypothetical protein BU23DRAFT_186006 [Bimuria novae-zelandiae CBS 107.79]